MERIRFGRSGLAGLLLRILLFLLIWMWASRSLQAGILPREEETARVIAFREKVRQIYLSQIEVREKGNNAGREVEAYLRYVKLPKGNPWCAAFVCWVYGRAGVKNPESGWSPALFPAVRIIWTREGGMKPKQPPPRAGDVFGIYFPEKGRIAHVGFVDEWKESWLITVEGNTNVLGSREGDGVYRKRRLQRTIQKVARYII